MANLELQDGAEGKGAIGVDREKQGGEVKKRQSPPHLPSSTLCHLTPTPPPLFLLLLLSSLEHMFTVGALTQNSTKRGRQPPAAIATTIREPGTNAKDQKPS
ncbi:hypothetical protein KOW79_010174 [Hemibagrus wyckioides]|uniref:Uncharacterized protein n=1 Tax=Hemibagrus wyckioides TaxID=337641 RepID=A0A9D3NT07_9TELE|nr:hypothetical protein KOW79_010174 [Hemibagrus wyckioides]